MEILNLNPINPKEVKDLSLDERNKAIEAIDAALDELVSQGLCEDGEIELVQQFINNYQKLEHHKVTTIGLYATDVPRVIEELKNKEDYDNLFWEITF